MNKIDTAEPQWLEDFTQDGAPVGTLACKRCGALVGWTGTGALAKVHHDSHKHVRTSASIDSQLRYRIETAARNQVRAAFESDLVGGQPVTVEDIGDVLFELYKDEAIRPSALMAVVRKLLEEDFLVCMPGVMLKRLTLSRGQFAPVSVGETYYQRLEDHRRLRARVRNLTVPQCPATDLFRRKWTCFMEQRGLRGIPCTEASPHTADLSSRGRCGWQWVADPVWDDEAAQYGIGVGGVRA